MKHLKKNSHYIFASLGVGGILAAGLMGGGGEPLLDTADDFVLLAKDQITIGSAVSLSSGNIGVKNAKGRITVGAKGSLSGDLYADTVALAAQSTVNGSVTAKKLTKAPSTEILGETSTAFSSPLVSPFPSVPSFTTGLQDITIRSNTEQTIQPGSYRNVTAGSRNALTFPGGVYNIDRLTIGSNATLIFEAPTTLNIMSTAGFGSKVVFSPAPTLELEDVEISFLGRALTFGSNSFISGIVTAPEANITLGPKSTFRGQIFGQRIVVGSGSVLSGSNSFEKESDLEKVATVDGAKIILNEIVIIQSSFGTFADLLNVAEIVDGEVTGYIPDLGLGKIEVAANTIDELKAKIDSIEDLQDQSIESATYNVLPL